jgi:hypothetical protein
MEILFKQWFDEGLRGIARKRPVSDTDAGPPSLLTEPKGIEHRSSLIAMLWSFSTLQENQNKIISRGNKVT